MLLRSEGLQADPLRENRIQLSGVLMAGARM